LHYQEASGKRQCRKSRELGEGGAASAYGVSAITQLVLGSFAAGISGLFFWIAAELTATRL
jgi:hypothetical protein